MNFHAISVQFLALLTEPLHSTQNVRKVPGHLKADLPRPPYRPRKREGRFQRQQMRLLLGRL